MGVESLKMATLANDNMSTIQEEIIKLKERFADVSDNDLRVAFKQVLTPRVHTRKEELATLTLKLKEIVGNFDKITLAAMKRTLCEVWKEKHPSGVAAKTTRQPSEWHKFMRENRDRVVQEHPNTSQHERIRILGVMYKAAKEAAAPNNTPPAATPTPTPTATATPAAQVAAPVEKVKKPKKAT